MANLSSVTHFVPSNVNTRKKCTLKTKITYLYIVIYQLFKRRNVATVEDDGILEDDGMADSGYLESQANNMDPLMVRNIKLVRDNKSLDTN